MVRRKCVACSGTGRVIDFFSPLNWIPFHPVTYTRCGTCNGLGHYLVILKKPIHRHYRKK